MSNKKTKKVLRQGEFALGDVKVASEIMDLQFQVRRLLLIVDGLTAFMSGKFDNLGLGGEVPLNIDGIDSMAYQFCLERYPNMGLQVNDTKKSTEETK